MEWKGGEREVSRDYLGSQPGERRVAVSRAAGAQRNRKREEMRWPCPVEGRGPSLPLRPALVGSPHRPSVGGRRRAASKEIFLASRFRQGGP